MGYEVDICEVRARIFLPPPLLPGAAAAACSARSQMVLPKGFFKPLCPNCRIQGGVTNLGTQNRRTWPRTYKYSCETCGTLWAQASPKNMMMSAAGRLPRPRPPEEEALEDEVLGRPPKKPTRTERRMQFLPTRDDIVEQERRLGWAADAALSSLADAAVDQLGDTSMCLDGTDACQPPADLPLVDECALEALLPLDAEPAAAHSDALQEDSLSGDDRDDIYLEEVVNLLEDHKKD